MRKPAFLVKMARSSQPFVSLLVVVAYFLTSACLGTPTEGQSLRQRSRLSNLFRATPPPFNTACSRLCRSTMKNQEKRRVGKQVKPADFKDVKSE